MSKPRPNLMEHAKALGYDLKTKETNMSEPKHTPGPWRYTEGQLYGQMPRMDCVEFVIRAGEQPIFEWDKKVLIGYEPWIQFKPKEMDEIHKANGHLIAAAPDMLEALEWCLKMFKILNTGYHTYEIEILNRAIAKAKGES